MKKGPPRFLAAGKVFLQGLAFPKLDIGEDSISGIREAYEVRSQSIRQSAGD